MIKEQFVKTYYSMAQRAGKKYNLNPTVILAQAAHESAWGDSYSARIRRNFFGIIATAKTNEYWDGTKSASQTNPNLIFRIYKTELDSFMDFARLISSNYKTAASVSNDSTQYAKAIAYSPYISEQNGDNRPAYQKAITNNSSYIESMMVELKKKLLCIKRVLQVDLLHCFYQGLPFTIEKG
ncbi:MAG: glucosaminidase domain-containing protein [Bacteroidia bacterium]|nr:glucosaminidase domain-containing protein [Bacteroidia bacterium]